MIAKVLFLQLLIAYWTSAQEQPPRGPLTDHFVNWLLANGFESESFDRPDVGPNGSFGGKLNPAQTAGCFESNLNWRQGIHSVVLDPSEFKFCAHFYKTETKIWTPKDPIQQNEFINHEPVIFIHGTGDTALHTQAPMATGWSRSIQYFLEQNYTSAELYATTWGDAWGTGNILDSYNTMHTCSYLISLRRFIEAVIFYTGAPKVDVIAHSVGVPLTRRVLKGGSVIATDGNCTLGKPLTSRVDTFLGISGPNYGLCVCQLAQTIPAWCNALDGLYPGYSCDDQLLCGYAATPCEQKNYSAFLERLNRDPMREADYIYSMWSDVDEILLYKSFTWGKPTSRIPGQNGRWISDRNSHVAMKDFTELRQFEAVSRHSI